MTGWIVFLCIVLALCLLFGASLSVHISAGSSHMAVSVHYLLLGIHILPQKEKKQKKPKQAKEKKKKPKETAEKEQKKRTLPETVELIRSLISAMLPPLGIVRSHLRINNVELYMVVCGDDAADCATSYGKMCAYVNGGLAALRNLFRIHVKKCMITPDFTGSETRYSVSCKVKIRVIFLLAAGVYGLLRAVKQLGPSIGQKGGYSHETASH